jgi:peptidyl-tRNA hydrolase, PTH2 family
MSLNDILKTFSDYEESFYNQNLNKNLNNESYVMYILINKSLPMKKGKIASQVGHAVQKITEYCLKNKKDLYDKYCANSYAKVVLKVPNEEVMLKILYELKDIHKSYVVDEGRTQIKPNSLTAIGFIPMAKKDIPSCLKELKLL